MLEAGKLRHRITILQPDTEQDSSTGEMEMVWSELATVWAGWEPLSVKDFIASASVQNNISVRAVIRHRSGILPNFRVRKNSVDYEIVGPPLPDKDSGIEYLTLMLAEVIDE